MKTVLIAGLETIAGANLATHLADRYRILGLSSDASVAIEGVASSVGEARDIESARRHLAATSPDMVVYCGPESVSVWSGARSLAELKASRIVARHWARAAAERGCRFTLISSDAVFSGPWTFHEEDGVSFCPSEEAEVIRATESETAELCPETLVIRTNTFGWSPDTSRSGWLESLLAQIEAGDEPELRGGVAHATPIAAAHLAEIVERAWLEELEGTFHVAGAERVSPSRFVRRLAETFDVSTPSTLPSSAVDERPVGFGRGETSLQTRRVRKALCVAMPTLAEGLQRVKDESDDGRAERLRSTRVLRERVA